MWDHEGFFTPLPGRLPALKIYALLIQACFEAGIIKNYDRRAFGIMKDSSFQAGQSTSVKESDIDPCLFGPVLNLFFQNELLVAFGINNDSRKSILAWSCFEPGSFRNEHLITSGIKNDSFPSPGSVPALKI